MEVFTIYGPPGTGKTTALLGVLEKELETYAPEEIAYVSFTKEGSEQGRSRAIEKFGYKPERFPHFRTLHSMAFRSLKLSRNDVLGKSDYRDLSKKIGMSFTGYYSEEFRHDDDMYLFFDELYRNNPKAARAYLDQLDIRKLTYVRRNYALFKKTKNMVDYTDMIQEFVERGLTIDAKIAIVDEAQDLTSLQWRMVWLAFKNCDKVYIAGDDDQAIYQWSGADVDYFLSIEGTSRILRHSYRLPNEILQFAKRISGQITRRIDKAFESRGEEGVVDFHSGIESVTIDPEKPTMILTRNHAFMKKIEYELRKRCLIYTINGEPSVKKEEIEVIRLYEKVRKTNIMTQQEELRLKKHLRARFDLRAPWYDSVSWNPDQVEYLRDIVRTKTDGTKSKLKVSTIHASKGAEADHVVLLLDITANVRKNLNANPDSEHRAFYVGATRAREHLDVVYATSKIEYPIY